MYVYACVHNECCCFVSTEIDLCKTGLSGCQHSCVKTNGSYYCDCWTGYQLHTDNMTCKGILFTYCYVYTRHSSTIKIIET